VEPSAAQTEPPASTATPTALPGPSFTNPVYKLDFPDPHVLLVGDTYYAYSTNSYPSNIPALKSTDLVHWENIGDVMPVLPKWSVFEWQYMWAPGVIQIEDTFVMYYTAREKESKRQCIGRAVSESPEGTFTDESSEPLICQLDLGGSIDPYPFRDDDGQLYLLWKNDGNCCSLPVSLWIQELSPDGLNLAGEPRKLLDRDQGWERPLVENPAMVEHNDIYYLFYSANNWGSMYYAIGYAVCETALGPCEKPLSKPWLDYENPVMGPGGQSFFTDEEGNLWMAYHAWTGANIGNDMGERSLRIDLITFEGDQPVTNGPTYTPQLLP
jgi:beta-xylosidase